MSDRDGDCDIYVSRFKNGQYVEPEKLSTAINSEFDDWDACISPDESYIIFGSYDRPDGYGRGDLYISFHNDDGSWTEAVNMGGKVNSSEMDIAPWISFDGKYIFLSSNKRTHASFSEWPITYDEKIRILNSPGKGNTDIYWVDAKIIEELRPMRK